MNEDRDYGRNLRSDPQRTFDAGTCLHMRHFLWIRSGLCQMEILLIKKSETIKSTAEDRMKMTSLAIAPFPEFVLRPYEALREEVSCSYQTMEYFKEMYPEDEFYFIIGADSLMAIETWVHPERIFPTCTILATYRDEIKTKRRDGSADPSSV